MNTYPCEHRVTCCCKLGRFGGKPSLGICMTACEIGAALVWPTVTPPPMPVDDPANTSGGCCDGSPAPDHRTMTTPGSNT